MKLSLLYLALLAAAAPAFVVDAHTNTSVAQISFTWDSRWEQDFQIHESCNATQTNQLTQAFAEVKILAQHAKEHTLRYGNSSEFYHRYFGDAPSGEVVGIYENVILANKTGVLFRCDDPDDNCRLDGWAGHWRGENGSDETVICDLSYTSRLFLSQVCSRGWTVSEGKNTAYWAGDLLHRIWHTDKIGQGVVGHYGDTFEECLELGEVNSTFATRNSASLRYYALDVYAFDIAVPGAGCTGDLPDSSSLKSASELATSSASQKTSKKSEQSTVSATATETQAGSECHTHADGATHCV